MIKESTINRIIHSIKGELISLVDKVDSWLFSEPLETKSAIEINLVDEVKKAHQEWIKSKIYFKSVTDPDLVDHAIYMEEAAKKKYEYLLKKVKNIGITN